MNTSLLTKQLSFLVCHFKPFVNLAILRKFNALKHLPDTEDLINKTWKHFAILVLLMKKYPIIQKLIISTLVSLPKSNWMTFLDKLNTYKKEEPNTLHILLFQILLQELISREKDFKPFWTPVYKALSEKLLLPTEIDYLDLVLNSSNLSLKKQEGQLQFLTMNKINLPNRNLPKTYYQLSTSSVVDKWEKEVIKPDQLKSLKIKIKPNLQQRKIIDEWINTSRYVYNKTICLINKGHPINHFLLRDKLVTEDTKKHNKEYKVFEMELQELKNQKNVLNNELKQNKKNIECCIKIIKQIEIQDQLINDKKKTKHEIIKKLSSNKNEEILDWELNTPKAVRDGAVNDVCKAYKTGFTNLKLGNIKYFNMHYKKKTNPDKCVCIPKSLIKNKNGIIHLSSYFFKENCKFKMGKNTLKKFKDLVIANDSRIIKQKDDYWLIVPVPFEEVKKQPLINYCGIDPGVRTFMTSFGNNGCIEYKHDEQTMQILNNKLLKIKKLRKLKLRGRILKRQLNKIENKKNNLIDELHWKVINDILEKNDVIFYGNIKSHNIVKNKKNSKLNKNMNDLKFYKFKERLLFKANEIQKRVILVNEAYTSQTCSYCGCMYKIGNSKIYECKQCEKNIDRDMNAAKNILMKGILSL